MTLRENHLKGGKRTTGKEVQERRAASFALYIDYYSTVGKEPMHATVLLTTNISAVMIKRGILIYDGIF